MPRNQPSLRDLCNREIAASNPAWRDWAILESFLRDDRENPWYWSSSGWLRWHFFGYIIYRGFLAPHALIIRSVRYVSFSPGFSASIPTIPPQPNSGGFGAVTTSVSFNAG